MLFHCVAFWEVFGGFVKPVGYYSRKWTQLPPPVAFWELLWLLWLCQFNTIPSRGILRNLLWLLWLWWAISWLSQESVNAWNLQTLAINTQPSLSASNFASDLSSMPQEAYQATLETSRGIWPTAYSPWRTATANPSWLGEQQQQICHGDC